MTGPDGMQVVFPEGALDRPTEIGIARVSGASAGVPGRSDAFPGGEFVYELTPHDVQFNLPVTLSTPVSATLGATSTPQIFMASPGEGWSPKNATLSNGTATWERTSFSYAYPGVCFVPTSMAGDPFWCGSGGTLARVAATPTEALVRTAASRDIDGDAGVFRLDAPANLAFTSRVTVPGHCINVSVELFHSRFDASTSVWSPRTSLLVTTVPITPTSAGSSSSLGIATFRQSLNHINNGKSRYSLVASFSCPTVNRVPNGRGGSNYSWNYSTRRIDRLGDSMVINVNVPAPTTFYTVGGTATGMSGPELALQLNGATLLPVVASGSFEFAGTLGASTPYNVTIAGQPAGQTCTVANGSGVLAANVSNVTVSCAATPASTVKYPLSVYIDFTATSAVTLQNNGGDTFSGEGDASYEFPTPIAAGATYNVTVLTAPAGQTCTVRNGVGIMSATDRSNVGVYCVSPGVPVFVTNPKSLYASVGQTPMFEVDVTGALPIRLQWSKSSPDAGVTSDLVGETERRVTLPPVTLADHEFRYYATASNGRGDAVSDRAVLNVCLTGPVAVAGTPPSTQGQFCPRTASRSLPDAAGFVTLFWQEVIYSTTASYFESMSVVVHPVTGVVNSVFYQLNDPTNTLSWLCTAVPVGGRPTCTGASVNPTAGTLTFSNTVVGNGTNVTLNGSLKY